MAFLITVVDLAYLSFFGGTDQWRVLSVGFHNTLLRTLKLRSFCEYSLKEATSRTYALEKLHTLNVHR